MSREDVQLRKMQGETNARLDLILAELRELNGKDRTFPEEVIKDLRRRGKG